jgi:hypothetical protein
MRTKLRLLQFSLIVFVAAAACKKNSSSTTDNTQMTLITSSAWKIDTAGLDLDHNGTIDYGDTTLGACYKDNTYLFYKDSTGIANNGTIKCDESEETTFPFTWSFVGSDQKKITSTANPLLAEGVDILTLTSTKLVVYKDTTIQGIDLWYILQMKH